MNFERKLNANEQKRKTAREWTLPSRLFLTRNGCRGQI